MPIIVCKTSNLLCFALQGAVDELTAEEEMGLAGGATADDAEAEYIRSITEKEIVTGATLVLVFQQLAHSFVHKYIIIAVIGL